MTLFSTTKAKILAAIGICAVIVVVVAALHNVPAEITSEDKAVLTALLPADFEGVPQDFDGQVVLIRTLQAHVMAQLPSGEQIPAFHSREPADAVKYQSGLCFDQARMLEKLVRVAGFDVRYTAVYRTDLMGGFWQTMLNKSTSSAASHAAIEVKTSKGWMIVNSNTDWIGLDDAHNPVSFAALKKMSSAEIAALNAPDILTHDVVAIPGLYSRHGLYYAPYTRYVPDVNWNMFLTNLNSWLI